MKLEELKNLIKENVKNKNDIFFNAENVDSRLKVIAQGQLQLEGVLPSRLNKK